MKTLIPIFALIISLSSCLLANPPANTYRSTANKSGGRNYYSSSNKYLGRSTSNTRGVSNYYNGRNGQYNRTNGSGTNIGKFQSPSDGSIKSGLMYNSKSSGKSSYTKSSSSSKPK